MMKDVMDLYAMPSTYQFTEQEVILIKKHQPKYKFKIKYAFYNKRSSNGRYIAFIIDTMANSTRKSGVENYWEYICERELSNIEYSEMIENFGTQRRRFVVWYYDCIEKLQEDDKLYNIITPLNFVNACKQKGYSKNIQFKMAF